YNLEFIIKSTGLLIIIGLLNSTNSFLIISTSLGFIEFNSFNILLVIGKFVFTFLEIKSS
ncbi:hypothetical protein, partial [Streptomyces gougerotii]|uniref:hypothetical protein n=1 Tax=Streptomyces gougerotii TaxID=53448 RepID=UPI001E2B142A